MSQTEFCHFGRWVHEQPKMYKNEAETEYQANLVAHGYDSCNDELTTM